MNTHFIRLKDTLVNLLEIREASKDDEYLVNPGDPKLYNIRMNYLSNLEHEHSICSLINYGEDKDGRDSDFERLSRMLLGADHNTVI